MFHVPETYRVTEGPLYSDATYGNNGAFVLPGILPYRKLAVIATDGHEWEHVSIHATDGQDRNWTPGWDEMCLVKDTFWDAEDLVVQFHPRKSQYRNYHPYTLHLWRPIGVELPEPDPDLVGPDPSQPRILYSTRRS